MKLEELEAKVLSMEKQIKTLQTLLDIEEIKKLQREYGYYLEHWMYQEIVDCFSDGPDTRLDFFPGSTYLGKKGVMRYFEEFKEPHPEFLHQIMQLSPVIHMDPDGKTAKGRWYGYGPLAIPLGKGVSQSIHCGTYEMEYVKEDGIWKIKVFRWNLNYISTPAEGFVKPERVKAVEPGAALKHPVPDVPGTGTRTVYPAGYIFPFHYKHPVTGKKTTEDERNKSIKGTKPYK